MFPKNLKSLMFLCSLFKHSAVYLTNIVWYKYLFSLKKT